MVWHPDAETEYEGLDGREAVAVDNVVRKLEAVGLSSGFPHTSNVESARDLRELRPRSSRSRTRAFYRLVDRVFVIGALGPEASVDKKGFTRAVQAAERRLDELELPAG